MKYNLKPQDKLQDKLRDVLGEEMFNVCLESPEKAAAFGWLFSFAIADFDQKQGISSVTSNVLLETKEELGEAFCLWCSQNSSNLRSLITLLDKYVNTYEINKKNKEHLNHLFQRIHGNNYKARAVSLVKAYKKDQPTNLIDLFERINITLVSDLKGIFSQRLCADDESDLRGFMGWLKEDLMAVLCNDLQRLFNKSRTLKLMRSRAMGSTLHEISLDLGITRQRVRQIEKTLQNHFNNYVATFWPHYILSAFAETINYVSVNTLEEYFGSLSDIVFYCLKESNCSAFQWCSQLNGFIIGDAQWYSRLKDYKNGLSEMLEYNSVDPLIREIMVQFSLPIDFNDTKKIILSGYSLSGKVYLRNRISLSQMYHAVLERFYPNGIELYNPSEANCFRNHVRRLFGEVNLPKNNRALDVRLADFTILCDRRKRILPSGVKVSPDLLNKIHEAIKASIKHEILFKELFETFKNELLQTSNISNSYFLQGLLKYTFADEFDFTRYSLKKREDD
ncbi:hypothetical protein ACPUYX_19695 [Desulfosporosinus sp. SYSU MS00001]|uniref:hypothetical protein n=1 Tax=Desulfosporosinus sp. SYSU MS00001 TaxID=3416284 RepID=UPI003CF8FE74